MKKISIMPIFILIIIVLLSGCRHSDQGKLHKVGMLVETSIHDQVWAEKGYKGLRAISEKFDVDVYFKEGIQTKQEVINAVDDLVDKGVNLIFGQSNTYGKYFVEISSAYPKVHFVYFNGGEFEEDVTSLNFSSNAMGFFSGMIAGKMTETNHVGVIGAFEWQPEIEGFYEGVTYQNPAVEAHIKYVNGWNNTAIAMKLYKQLRQKNVDVFYPAGDSYSTEVIERASNDGVYAIGYVSDQSSIDESAVLTSTIQHVEKLYVLAAKKFDEGKLRGGVLTFDMQDEVVSLGEFSKEVPEEFRKKMNEAIEAYKETGLLPHQRKVD